MYSLKIHNQQMSRDPYCLLYYRQFSLNLKYGNQLFKQHIINMYLYSVPQISCLLILRSLKNTYERAYSLKILQCVGTQIYLEETSSQVLFKDFSDKCWTTALQNRTEYMYFCRTPLDGCFRIVCKLKLLSLIPSLCPFFLTQNWECGRRWGGVGEIKTV